MNNTRVVDVTRLVDLGDIDSESAPLYKCVCGKQFDAWDAILGVYKDNPWQCPHCSRKLIFSMSVQVLEIVDE